MRGNITLLYKGTRKLCLNRHAMVFKIPKVKEPRDVSKNYKVFHYCAFKRPGGEFQWHHQLAHSASKKQAGAGDVAQLVQC